MIDVKQANSYANSCEYNILYHKCISCNKILKVNQIIRKNIDENSEFAILIFYCKKCDDYTLKFRTIRKANFEVF